MVKVTLEGQMIKWSKLSLFYVYAYYISKALKVPASFLYRLFLEYWLFMCASMPLSWPQGEARSQYLG